jgi:glycine betaine/proline transport system ATP-binding protein
MSNNEKISCRSLWKVFGAHAERFLANNPNASYSDFTGAGLVAGVRDANISVGAGEIFVIMGLSGSGKSTLVRCLSRLIEPTAGEVLFEGQNLLEMDAKELMNLRRHKMGMVFQHFALLPHLTVLENTAFPLEVQGVPRKERLARAAEVVELVGLKGREDRYPDELSGGQQQRVGIARSLAVKPEIWFLDEPFSALDPLIRYEMQSEFLRIQKLLHKTIIFITHDFDEAIRLADRVAIMKDGVIEQIGTPEELLTNPATEYVEKFTGNVSRSKVLTAASIATREEPEKIVETKAIADTMKIVDAYAHLPDDNGFAVVEDADGRKVGFLNRQHVVDVLLKE